MAFYNYDLQCSGTMWCQGWSTVLRYIKCLLLPLSYPFGLKDFRLLDLGRSYLAVLGDYFWLYAQGSFLMGSRDLLECWRLKVNIFLAMLSLVSGTAFFFTHFCTLCCGCHCRLILIYFGAILARDCTLSCALRWQLYWHCDSVLDLKLRASCLQGRWYSISQRVIIPDGIVLSVCVYI